MNGSTKNYNVILEKNGYFLIRRGNDLKEYAIVKNLDRETGEWDYTCGQYAYEFKGAFLANEAEMLEAALTEFREKTEEDYVPAKQIEIRREDYTEGEFLEILNKLDLDNNEVWKSFTVYARVNRETLVKTEEEENDDTKRMC